MGIGETGVGEMGVGETGPNLYFILNRIIFMVHVYHDTCICMNMCQTPI